MKLNDFLNRAFKAVKKIFQHKVEKIEINKPKPEKIIPKHETKTYHEPPCSGIANDAGKKRKAKIRMQKKSRIINRKAA
jgi:hypothetical protein